jgi:hypothetical protein
MGKINHIVFSESAEGSFKQAIKIKSIVADKLIALYDNLSNGRISNLINIDDRANWLKELNEQDNYRYVDIEHFKENYDEFYNDISEINDGDTVYLWHGHCDREICGMMYTLHLLKDKEINAYIVNVSDKIIENNNGMVVEIIASSASEIVPEKLGEYLKKAIKIDRNEYKNLTNQWGGLIKENSMLRTYKNEKVQSVSEDYFDKDILKFADKEYRNSARTIGDVIVNTEPRLTDDYIFWRIKELIKLGDLKFRGNFNVIRQMQICITDKGLEYLSGFHDSMNFWNERKRADERKLGLINEIKEQGRLEERVRIAKNLLDVLDVETIADKTGLTVVQVRSLKEQE